MVKIYADKAKSLISTIANSKIKAVLIYGPDSGRVLNLYKEIAAKITPDLDDPFMVSHVNSSDLDGESTILYDEMMAIPFGAGKRLVTVKHADGADPAKTITVTLKDLPDTCHETSFMLITAGELTASNALRKLFESKDDSLISIPCYKQDNRDLSAVIFNLVKQRGLHVEQEAVTYLSETCKGDANIIENEIEKLSLYLGEEGKQITYDDVVSLTGNNTESQLQDVCNALFKGDRYEIAQTFQKAINSGIAPVAIFRSLQKYLEKLHLAYYYMKDGNTIDMAVKYIKPPIFYKQVPVFKSHLRKLSVTNEKHIFAKYGNLLKAEFDIKQTNADPNLITSSLLQRVAS